MGIETVYQDGIEASVQAQLRNPGPVVDQKTTFGSAIASFVTGPVTGALESAGSVADLLSGAATPYAASGTPSMFSTEYDDSARQKMLAGESFDVSGGNVLRRKSRDFAPNPETSSTADNVIHGLTRFASKAIVDVAMMGPIGAIPLALDEGNTTTQTLRAEGIDTATAVKVGAVVGVASGASAVLPLGGSTLAKTAALVVAGGPGTFMAQETLIRDILAKAGYKDEAAKHDPFDPLGLSLSLAIPGLFGAAHMRTLSRSERITNAPTIASVVQTMESGGRRNGTNGEILQGPVTKYGTAKGEMQVLDSTALQPGHGIVPAKALADGSIDAADRARVGVELIGALEKKYGISDKAMAAYNWGEGNLDSAIAKHGDNWLAYTPKETQKYVAKGTKMLGEQTLEHASADPAVIDAARVKVTNEALDRSMPDTHDAYSEVMRASDEVAAGRMPEVAPVPTTALPEFKAWFGESQVVEDIGERAGQPKVVYHGTVDDFSAFSREEGGKNVPTPSSKTGLYFIDRPDIAENYAVRREGSPNIMPVYLSMKDPARAEFSNMMEADKFLATDYPGDGAIVKVTTPAGKVSTVYAIKDPSQAKSATGNSGKFDPNSPSLTDPLQPGERNPRSLGTNSLPDPDNVAAPTVNGKPVKSAPVSAAKTDKAASEETTSIDSQRAQALAESDPTMQVKLPGSDETITVTDALERARAEAKEETDSAELIRAAAECAMSYGA